ncbi:fimbria major subunit [bacterium]|nr:fimbria major subunit [bacterium]
MKKIYGFAALCAAMTLASCSNENEPNNVVPSGDLEKCYIAVNLATAPDTRAMGFKEGEGNEDDIHDVTFIIFDSAGKYMTMSDRITNFSFKPGTNDIENTATNIVEIDKVPEKTVGKIITVINAPFDKDDSPFTTAQTVDDVRKTVINYYKSTIGNDEYFVMSNAAYGTGNYATDFTDKVYTSLGAARAATPENIYVERVAARVDLKAVEDFGKTTVTGENADGTEMTINVAITGYNFIYATTNSYFVKDIDGVGNPFEGWNSTYRSHWAAGVTGDDYATKDIYYSNATENGVVGTVAEGKNKKEYLFENVNQSTPTYVVITGEITVNGKKGKDAEIYQLWQNGKYYLMDGAVNQLCGYLQQDGYLLVSDAEERTVNPTDVTFTESMDASKDYDAYLTINVPTGYTLKKNGTAIATTGTTYNFDNNTEMMSVDGKSVQYKNKYRIYKWGGGLTYYYVPIQPKDQGSKMGVIRNHIYDITFRSLKGLGTPLFNPSNKLIPKDPDDPNTEVEKWFFNASINVLKWATYTQDMNFGEE